VKLVCDCGNVEELSMHDNPDSFEVGASSSGEYISIECSKCGAYIEFIC